MPDILTTDIVTLADLKAAMNVTITDDDAKLLAKLEAARGFLEGWTGPLSVFETADAVPPALKEALKLYAGHLYDADAAEVPEGFFSLIGPYREWGF